MKINKNIKYKDRAILEKQILNSLVIPVFEAGEMKIEFEFDNTSSWLSIKNYDLISKSSSRIKIGMTCYLLDYKILSNLSRRYMTLERFTPELFQKKINEIELAAKSAIEKAKNRKAESDDITEKLKSKIESLGYFFNSKTSLVVYFSDLKNEYKGRYFATENGLEIKVIEIKPEGGIKIENLKTNK